VRYPIAVRAAVAKVIAFYVPVKFQRKASSPPPQAGRVIEFRVPERKPA
jgi:hypothetical protein